jgi:hypothetical protein
VRNAFESLRAEATQDVFGSARQCLDLNGSVAIPERSAPSLGMGLGMKIADEYVGARLEHTRQLPRHAA